MAQLLITIGGHSVVHELAEAITTIGRSSDNALQIDDPSVSSRHAQLHQVGEAYHLQDCDSTNGTRVNGETITTVALKAGDRIRFGKVEAHFETEAEDAETTSLPLSSHMEVRPAEISARPVDFENASPFPQRRNEKDPVRTAIFAAAVVAIVAFIASMLALAQMRPPNL